MGKVKMPMTNSELKRLVTSFRNGIVGCRDADNMCFMVCAPLQGYLALFGIKTKLVEADFGKTNHVWLELPDGRIIDPTASQFSGKFMKLPEVFIGPMPEIYKKWTSHD